MNICCTHLSYTFSESWVRKDSVGTCPEKFSSWKFSGTERFTKKFHFSLISVSSNKKKYWARVPTILMPQTFPIASLNRYTPNFSGAWPRLNSLAYSCNSFSQSQATKIPCRQKKLLFQRLILAINKDFLSILQGVRILLTQRNRNEHKIWHLVLRRNNIVQILASNSQHCPSPGGQVEGRLGIALREKAEH